MNTKKNTLVTINQLKLIDLRGQQSVSSNYPFFSKTKVTTFPSLIQQVSIKPYLGMNMQLRKLSSFFSSNEFKSSIDHASVKWSDKKIHFDNL